MDECFDFAVNQHSHKRMVGTRQVFREEDEMQPNGKVFKKWVMGEYRWKSYLQVRNMTYIKEKIIVVSRVLEDNAYYNSIILI